MPKFFVAPKQIFDEEIVILGEDARHIGLSLRMKIGDQIIVSDGNKTDYNCSISSIEPTIVRCEILEKYPCESEPLLRFRVFQCLPKSDKMEYVVQKAVELGAAEIYPVYSSRCIVKPNLKSGGVKDKKIERWQRIAYEAAEQSGRGIIPEVHDYVSLEYAYSLCNNDFMKFICYEDENDVSIRKYLTSKQGATTRTNIVSFFIGPEGGFSEDEVKLAKTYGIPAVSLGKRILRTETASSFVLSILSYLTEIK